VCGVWKEREEPNNDDDALGIRSPQFEDACKWKRKKKNASFAHNPLFASNLGNAIYMFLAFQSLRGRREKTLIDDVLDPRWYLIKKQPVGIEQ